AADGRRGVLHRGLDPRVPGQPRRLRRPGGRAARGNPGQQRRGGRWWQLVAGRTRADEALIAKLAAGSTVAEAAEAARVAERTVYRRLADKSFRAELSRARARVVDRAVGRLAEATVTAADALVALLESDQEATR